jgi:hypothetical protein
VGLPVFAYLFLPAITANFQPTYLRLKELFRRYKPETFALTKWAMPLLFLGFIVYGVVFLRREINAYAIFGVGAAPTTLEPIEFIKGNDLQGPILNDTDIGSYLTFYLYPEERVFADNRFSDAYTNAFLEQEYQGLFTNEETWKRCWQI